MAIALTLPDERPFFDEAYARLARKAYSVTPHGVALELERMRTCRKSRVIWVKVLFSALYGGLTRRECGCCSHLHSSGGSAWLPLSFWLTGAYTGQVIGTTGAS